MLHNINSVLVHLFCIFRCIACGKQFQAGTSELEKHANGLKHKKKAAALQVTPCVLNTRKTETDDHMAIVKTAEIKICAYFAEHNVSFLSVDHFTQLLKEIIPDSKIIQDAQLKRTKCTEIIKNVICKQEINELVAILQEAAFSVLVDESTDIADKKSMCLLAKYVDKVSGAATTKLLEFIEVDAKDCSAVNLYKEFKNCLGKQNSFKKCCWSSL